MIEQKTINPIKDLTRGGQTFMHSLRMFVQVFKYTFFSALILFLVLFISLSAFKTTERNRYFLGQYIEAELKLLLNDQAYNIIKNPKGTHPSSVEIPSVRFIQESLTQQHLKACQKALNSAFHLALGISIAAWVLFLGYFKYKGKRATESREILGQGRVKPKALNRLLKSANKASDFTLGGVPLVQDSEVQHLLLAGTTGTGKSVCLQELIDQVRSKGQKAVIFDIDGTLIANYFRPEKDIILNPLDERCPAWNIWQECQDKADYETIAHSLMPLHLSGNDPFWINAAHTIFTEVAEKLSLKKEKTNALLLDALFTERLESLSQLVRGTPAESLVSERNEKTALSIKATLSTYCKSLFYLRDEADHPLFSIRRWIEGKNQDSWLFIATDAQKIDALKPLLSVWFDVAAKSVLSLSPYLERRLWFFADELPKLHRLPSLKALLERGRKYGACFAGSIQDVHQIHSVYGRNDAETLTSLFNTKIFFRSQEPESINWMSKVMGGLELLEKKEGFSYGANDMRDGVSIHQERRREPVVKEAEFSALKDLEAFIKLPGAWPVTQINFEIQKRIFCQPYFVPRKMVEIKMPAEMVEQSKNIPSEKPVKIRKKPKQGEELNWEMES